MAWHNRPSPRQNLTRGNWQRLPTEITCPDEWDIRDADPQHHLDLRTRRLRRRGGPGAGKYQNASEALRDAVRGLQQRLKADELKLELLRTRIKAGLDALDRGAFTEVDDADLDNALDGLASSDAP